MYCFSLHNIWIYFFFAYEFILCLFSPISLIFTTKTKQKKSFSLHVSPLALVWLVLGSQTILTVFIGNFLVILGTFWYFWVHLGGFEYLWVFWALLVLLGTFF